MDNTAGNSSFDWVDYGPPGEATPTPEWDTTGRRAVTRAPALPTDYVSLSLADSEIVYDRTETRAWIQSSIAVSTEDDGRVPVSPPDTGDRDGE